MKTIEIDKDQLTIDDVVAVSRGRVPITISAGRCGAGGQGLTTGSPVGPGRKGDLWHHHRLWRHVQRHDIPARHPEPAEKDSDESCGGCWRPLS